MMNHNVKKHGHRTLNLPGDHYHRCTKWVAGRGSCRPCNLNLQKLPNFYRIIREFGKFLLKSVKKREIGTDEWSNLCWNHLPPLQNASARTPMINIFDLRFLRHAQTIETRQYQTHFIILFSWNYSCYWLPIVRKKKPNKGNIPGMRYKIENRMHVETVSLLFVPEINGKWTVSITCVLFVSYFVFPRFHWYFKLSCGHK